MSHIFISYSRKDIDFAQKIVDALAASKVDAWIDWKSIPKGEKWEQEIYLGIEEADAFLFLISPDSVTSKMCNKEISHAVKNGKRILPIVIREADLKSIHPEISKRNWIFCQARQDDFNRAISEVQKTIHTNYEWLKYHTKLQGKALEWERQTDNSRLLRGKELEEAEQQLTQISGEIDPQPTKLQRQFVLASRMEEDRNRRTRNRIRNIITVVISALAVIAGILAIGQYEQKQAALANALAARSQAEINHYPQRSLLLAAEALKISPIPAANQALLQAMTRVEGQGLDVHQGYITAVAISPNEQRVAVSGSDRQVHLIDLVSADRGTVTLGGSQGVVLFLAFSPDSNKLAAYEEDHTILLWDFSNGNLDTIPVSFPTSFTVTTLTFDSNGDWLFVGAQDGVHQRINLNNLTAVPLQLNGLEKNLSGLVISPDGHWLAASTKTDGILIWDLLQTGSPVRALGDSSVQATILAFSPDNNKLAASGREGTVWFWDLKQVKESKVSLTNQLGQITHLKFSSDGTRLLASSGSVAQLWDLSGRSFEHILFSGHTADITQLFITNDNHWLITTSMDGTLRRWDVTSNQPGNSVQVMYGHDGAITSATMSSTSHWLVTGSDDNTARLWDITSFGQDDALLVVLLGHTANITSLAISNDNHLLATGSADQTIRLWDLNHPDPAKVPLILRQYEGSISKLLFSADGKWLMSSAGNIVRLWDLSTELPTLKLTDSHDGTVADILITPDSHQAFSEANSFTLGGDIRRWDLTAENLTDTRQTYLITDGPAADLAISPDGKWLAVGCRFFTPSNSSSIIPCATLVADRSKSGSVIKLPLEDKFIKKITTDTYTKVDFSPDSHWMISTSDSIAVIYDMTAQDIKKSGFAITAGKESLIDTIYPSNASIIDVKFSPDGKWLAIQHRSSSLSLWKTENLHTDPILLKAAGTVNTIVYTADSHYLVAGDEAGKVYAWNLDAVNLPPSVFQDHGAAVTSMAVSSDNKWLVTGSNDQTVRLRSVNYLNAGSIIDIACMKAGRNLSQLEWQQYLGDSDVQAVCSKWPLFQTSVNVTKETWRWKFLPVLTGMLKYSLFSCLGVIVSGIVGWILYSLYEKVANWWRNL